MNSCQVIKKELVDCVRDSPCFEKGKKFGECLRSDNDRELPKQCQELRNAYYICKRGQVK